MADETLLEAAQVYQEWRRTRGFAANTLRRDYTTLRLFVESAGPRLKVSSLGTQHIDAFFLSRSKMSPQTQNLDLSSLRTFFSFLESRGQHRKARTLLADYRPLKFERDPRIRIPVGEFPSLLDVSKHPRDRALLSLGLYLFLRSSEVRLLKVKNLSLSTDELSVRVPKTKEADVMPISVELAREMRSWLTFYSSQTGELNPEWYLIPTTCFRQWDRHANGQIISPIEQSLQPERPLMNPERIVQQALRGIGWKDVKKEGVHTLRRSGARALYDELAASDGHSNALETVSAMLHHKVMATTQVYLGLTESRRKRDRLIAGRQMFPSLSDPSITRLPVRQHDGTHG